MPERPAHHQDPDFKAAAEAVVEFAESVGYRHIIGLFVEEILDAALPHLQRMSQTQGGQNVDA